MGLSMGAAAEEAAAEPPAAEAPWLAAEEEAAGLATGGGSGVPIGVERGGAGGMGVCGSVLVPFPPLPEPFKSLIRYGVCPVPASLGALIVT